jgi:hypothetical protein
MMVKTDSVLGGILLGTIAGMAVGAVVYLVPIVALSYQDGVAPKDAAIFFGIGGCAGLLPGTVGGLLGRTIGQAIGKGKGAFVGAIVGGGLGGLVVLSCSFVSIIGMGM